MDITSPSSLWKDYDVTALPFNEYELSAKTENGNKIRELYFDGHTTVDGRVRAFIRIHENINARGVILFVPSKNDDINENAVKKFFGFGYTVAVLDYLGRSEALARYTFYPKSLETCNVRKIDVFDITEDAQYSRWYVWTCIARRAIKLLKHLYDKNIFAIGIGLGGCTVYKLASFDDGIKACATLLNINPKITGEGNALINYHASLDNFSYATLCKVPLMMAVSSNDEDGSIDEMSELAEETGSLKCFRIVERALSCGINVVYNEISEFFDQYDAPSLIPTITASNSEGNLYLNITVKKDSTGSVGSESYENQNYNLSLYVGFCIKDSRFRNWMKLPTISLGNDLFISHVNICQAENPIYAFASVKYENSNKINSSTVFSVIPKTLGINSKPGVSHRKIYDSSMGEDGWISRNSAIPYLKKGPYDIEGITSDNGSLITFKPGDPLFKVTAETLLQIMVCGKPQTLNVMVRDETAVYSCQVEIKTSDDWYKFSLSHLNFKSQNKSLSDWSQILMLEFSSSEQFTIGSVLWV